MATTVSHPVPSAQAQAIADLTGYEDAATLRWQQACVQAANTLTALPNGRYVNVRMERMRQGLELAQRGAITLPEDGEELSAVVRSGTRLPGRHAPAHLHLCGLPEALAGLQASPGGRSTPGRPGTRCAGAGNLRGWRHGCRGRGRTTRLCRPQQRPCPPPRAGPSAKRPPRSTSSSRSATWSSCSPCATWTT